MENIAEYIPPGASIFLESRTQTTVPIKNTNKITVTTKSTIPLINNVFFIIFPSDREMSFRKSFNFFILPSKPKILRRRELPYPLRNRSLRLSKAKEGNL